MKKNLEVKILKDIAAHIKFVMKEKHISLKLVSLNEEAVLYYMKKNETNERNATNKVKKLENQIKKALNNMEVLEKLLKIKFGTPEWLVELNKEIDIENSCNIIMQYLNALQKLINVMPRKVIFTKELLQKINNKCFSNASDGCEQENADDIVYLINHFKQLFEDGKNINNHLSKEIFSSERQDMLFNTWNIKHIHLNIREAGSKSAMKNNRSEFLLFCVVKKDKVYFIDVRKHPRGNEFSSYSFLEILHNNELLNEIGYKEVDNYVKNTLSPVVTNDDELYTIYNKYHLNLAFEIKGSLFFSFNGIASSGDNFGNSYFLQSILKNIRSFSSIYTEDHYIKFNPSDNNSCNGILEFKKENLIEKVNFNIEYIFLKMIN